MPEWMHNRAEHILAKNPSMPKGEAFAIATQQMHSLGKGPKDYGTAEGRRVAKAKFDTPKNDVKASNPGHLKSEKMEKKEAGLRVDFDLHGNPVNAQTHDEWLVSLFKRDGSFMSPAMLSHAPVLGKYGMAGFADELEKIAISKELISKVVSNVDSPAKLQRAGANMLHIGARGLHKARPTSDVAGVGRAITAMHGASEALNRADKLKSAGMLGDFAESAKKVLTTPIPGTPELFPHAAVEAAERFGKVAPAAAATTKAPVDWRAARQAAFRKQAGPGLRHLGGMALGGASVGGAFGGLAGASRKPKPDSDNFGDRHPMLRGMTSGALRGGVIGGAFGLNSRAFDEVGHAAGKLVNKAKAVGTVAKQDIAEQAAAKHDPEVEQVMKRVHDITSGRAKPGT